MYNVWMSKNPMPVAMQALPRIDAEPSIIRSMRFGEKLVLGLWAGFLAANIAILASALPNIYAAEAPMQCGSLGITNFVIKMIAESISVIIMLAVICYSGRKCISVSVRWKHVPFVGRIVKNGASVGVIIWCLGALAGFGTFALFLTTLMNLLHNPPPLPPNRSDVKACSEFILNTKPSDYGPDWLK